MRALQGAAQLLVYLRDGPRPRTYFSDRQTFKVGILTIDAGTHAPNCTRIAGEWMKSLFCYNQGIPICIKLLNITHMVVHLPIDRNCTSYRCYSRYDSCKSYTFSRLMLIDCYLSQDILRRYFNTQFLVPS